MPAARFLSVEHLPRLSKALGRGAGGKGAPEGFDDALRALADGFGNPRFIARTYVGSHCQATDPSDDSAEGAERRPLLATVDALLEGDEGGSLLVFGGAGTGKTSLLVILKLLHLAALWPRHHRCELLRLGADSIAQIEAIKTPRKTVLLLDGLNEDPLAADHPAARIAELARATAGFHHVIVTCRSSSNPTMAQLAAAGFGSKSIYLSPFNDPQVDKYLKRRFHRMEEPNRKRAKVVLAGMGPLGSRPLVLSAADDFLHSRTKEWSSFSIYEGMFEAWLGREGGKAGETSFDREALADVTIKVARLAAVGSTPGRVSSEELAGASLSADETAQLGRLDGRGGSMLRRDAKGGLRVSHPSIGEFLLALGVGRGVLQAAKKRIPASESMLEFLLEGRGSAIAWKALDLTRASLLGVDLQEADFSGALLAHAKLSGSSFTKALFDNADLKFAAAGSARFVDAGFKATNAAHANAAGAVFDRCRFTKASLADTSLAGATFDHCKLENTSFADADLSAAIFTRCEFAGCNFSAADLGCAHFRDCSFDGSKFDRASLVGATFTNTVPANLSLASTDLRGAQLDESFLGAMKNPTAAAWDPEVAKRLRFSQSQNAENAVTIDLDVSR